MNFFSIDDLFEDYGETPNTDEEIVDSSDEELELKKGDEEMEGDSSKDKNDAEMFDANDDVVTDRNNSKNKDDPEDSGNDVIQMVRKRLKNLELKMDDEGVEGNNSKDKDDAGFSD